MAHPCSSKKPPSWCNKKPSKARRKSAKACTCPKGWKSLGIMCKKGKAYKRSACAASPKGKGKGKGKGRSKKR